MNKLMKTYRVFFPDLYTLIMQCVLPLACIGLHIILAEMGIGLIVPVVTAYIMGLVDIIADFFVFEGIPTKDFSFGVLKTSIYGKRFLKCGLRIDQALRLIRLMVVEIIGGVTTYIELDEADPKVTMSGYVIYIIMVVLSTYLVTTLALNASRYLNVFMIYTLVSSMMQAVSLGISAIYYGTLSNTGNIVIWPVILFIVLCVAATKLLFRHMLLRYDQSFGSRDEVYGFEEAQEKAWDADFDGNKLNETGKKRFSIFMIVAFGVTLVMSVCMFIGFKLNLDLTNFMYAQMMYPACGVMIGHIILDRKKKDFPVNAYIVAIVTTVILMIMSIYSIIPALPNPEVQTNVKLMDLGAQIVLMISSLIFLGMLLTAGKTRVKNAGMQNKKVIAVLLFSLLFIVLYFTRFMISGGVYSLIDGNTEFFTSFVGLFANSQTWMMILLLIPNMVLTFIMFLGEEYGWRYYLQPVLQRRFGLRLGVLILGLMWGVWHGAADFFFYTTTTGPQYLCAQLITCISLGIFFAYVYMKTQNIWLPVILHFLNNNLVMVLSGETSSQAMQNNVVNWQDLPIALVSVLPFILFILMPIFNKKKEEAEY